MITKTDLEVLNNYTGDIGRVLSVYLDVDQSNAANLNRKFEAAFEAKIKAISRTLLRVKLAAISNVRFSSNEKSLSRIGRTAEGLELARRW